MARSEALAVQAGEATLAGTLLLPDEPPGDDGGRYPNVLLLASWLPRDRDGAWDRDRPPRVVRVRRRWRARPAGAPGRGAGRAGRRQPARGPPRLRRLGRRLGVDAAVHQDRRRARHAGGDPRPPAPRPAPDRDGRPRGGRRVGPERGDRRSGGERADPDRSIRPPLARRAASRRGRAQPDGHGPAAPGGGGARPLERGDHRARGASRGALRHAGPRGRHRGAGAGRRGAGDPHPGAGAGDDAASVGGAGPRRGRRVGRPRGIGPAGRGADRGRQRDVAPRHPRSGA